MLLSLPATSSILSMARRLDRGLVFGLVLDDQLSSARAAVRDLENVMFAPADPDGCIPWRDEFFTKIYAPLLQVPSSELMRVLTPGGVAWLASGNYIKTES